MRYQTAEDILKKLKPTKEELKEAQEVAEIKKAIGAARLAIHDAKARYTKQKLRSRSKKQADEDPFAELKDYPHREAIRDDYGWGFITENRMVYLFDLWDAREESKTAGNAQKFEDYVTRMLDTAWAAVGEEYMERIEAYEEKEKRRRRDAERIAAENNERTRRREAGLIV